MKEEQILESSKKLFTKYGYKKVTMDEIAKEAGVTKRTVYSYFKDKDEILKIFLIEETKNMKKIIDSVEAKKLEFIEKIHQVLYELFKYRRTNEFLNAITNEEITIRNCNVSQRLKIIDSSIKDYIKSKLIYAIEHKKIVNIDVDVATFLIYQMYVSLMFEWSNSNQPLNEEEIASIIVKILQNGIMYEEEKNEK